jgi:hypothetical protein
MKLHSLEGMFHVSGKRIGRCRHEYAKGGRAFIALYGELWRLAVRPLGEIVDQVEQLPIFEEETIA